MKKVLIVITKADWAGAQRIVYEICKGIIQDKNANIKVDVAVGDNGILAEKLRDMGIKVHVLKHLIHPIKPFIDIKGYYELKKLIKENKYDVVHCHSTKAGILGRLAACKLGVKKIIYTVHGWWPILRYEGMKIKVAIIVERYMAKKCTDLVLLSESDKKLTKEMKIGNEEQYSIIYNQITVDKVEKGKLRKELGVCDNTKIIGNVSRTDNPKNPKMFIEIAKEYFSNQPSIDTKFVWVGDGILYDECIKLVEQLNLSDKVKFIGFREDGINYMADFDLLLMTSNWEGVPITILEAMELGVPVLSSDVGGIKEVVGEECTFKNNIHINKIVEKIYNKDTLLEYSMKNNMYKEYTELYL